MMKKRITWTILIVLILAVALLAGCGRSPASSAASTDTQDPGTRLATYDNAKAGELPLLIARDGGRWYMLLNPYSTEGYKFSASDDLEKLHVVYEGKAGRPLQNLAAGDGYAAWVEDDGNHAKVMVYDAAKGKVKAINEFISVGNTALNGKVFIQDGNLYYLTLDSAESTAKVQKYALKSGKEEVFYEQPMETDAYHGCFSVSDGKILLCCNWAKRKTLELTEISLKDASVEKVSLLKGINQVFDAEKSGDRYALYYHDDRSGREKYKGCDNIGLYTPGDEDIELIFGFTKNSRTYAYHDDIQYRNGHVFWVYQWDSEDFGMQFIVCDYVPETHVTYTGEKAFGYFLDGEDLYTLVQDADKGFDKVHLYRRSLGK